MSVTNCDRGYQVPSVTGSVRTNGHVGAAAVTSAKPRPVDRCDNGPVHQWFLLVLAIASEVTGSLALAAAVTTPPWYAVVVVGYVASFVLLGAVLRAGMPLGVAYGVWGAIGVASTAALSSVIFDEKLTVVTILGLALVIAGVVVVELGSHRARTPQP